MTRPRPVALLLLVLAAGCGAANPPLRSAQVSDALAFSRCMRSHGVPRFPDPASGRGVPKELPQQLGVAAARFDAAEGTCGRLLPNGGAPTAPALAQSWSDFRSFARCMRRHGVSDWPDPSRYPRHPERPTFDLQSARIDPSTPQVTAKIRACAPLLHGTDPQRLGAGGS